MSYGMHHMNIMIINSCLSHGGVEKQIFYLLEHLYKKGLLCNLVTYQSENPSYNILLPDGVSHRKISFTFYNRKGFFKILFFPIWVLRLISFCLKNKVKLIHSWGPFDNIAGSFVSLILGIPHIASVRSINKWAFKGLSIWGKVAKKIVSNSLSAKNILVDKNVQPEKIEVINNGVDLNNFKYNKKNINSDFIFLCIGRISPVKNQLTLLEAFYELVSLKNYKNMFMVLCGKIENEDYYNKILNFIEKKKLSSYVEVLPYVKDVVSLYNRASCVVLPSFAEGTPNVILESMALGVPWIASPVSDIPMLSGDEKRGLLFSSLDKKGVMEGLIRISSHYNEKMLLDARKYIEENFSMDKMVERFISLYDEVVFESQ
ncbi:glycosyltransferase family 4 protein [Spirochaetia bacterium 38H-sp]|uniref:Glycosyltransferase family 4 protein n=1 Tax=Rarispira pelagica TaxID=3141764 RepID=A0ABU9UBW7_9SPIR